MSRYYQVKQDMMNYRFHRKQVGDENDEMLFHCEILSGDY